jgi:chromosome partitioning protein
MAKIVAVTNQKGGVGKTTTTVNLAYNLAKDQNLRVLLVDLDPQGNATSGLGIARESVKNIGDVLTGSVKLDEAISPTINPKLFIASTDRRLADSEVVLAQDQDRLNKLKEALSLVNNNYDVVLIDCPPSLGILTVNALNAATHVLMPVQAEYYALEGLSQLLETMQKVKKSLNPNLEILGVLMTMVDKRNSLSDAVSAEVAKHFPKSMFSVQIPRNVRLAEAPSHGKPISIYDKWSKGSRAYKKLSKEVYERLF